MRVCVLALVTISCATPQTRVPELQKKIEEMQRSEAASRKKIEELEERVFLLTDQLESKRVATTAAHSAPKLPVVTLRAPDPEKQTLLPAPGEEIQSSRDEIEYQGEARRTGNRPSLTGTGDKLGNNVLQERAESDGERAPNVRPQPASTADHDNLGVASAPTLPTVMSSGKVTPTSTENPIKLYRTAHEDLRRERHAEAERAFRDFVRRFPQHDYADNAQYWLGETLYAQKRYQEAAPEFRKVVQLYPTGNKAPDAMLKLGFCLERLGDGKKAVGVLAQVGKTYPGSDAARLAAQKLGEK